MLTLYGIVVTLALAMLTLVLRAFVMLIFVLQALVRLTLELRALKSVMSICDAEYHNYAYFITHIPVWEFCVDIWQSHLVQE